MEDRLARFKKNNTLGDLLRYATGPVSISNEPSYGAGVLGATLTIFGTRTVYFLRGDERNSSSVIVGRIELPSEEDTRGSAVEDFEVRVYRGSGILGGEFVGTI